MIEETLKEWREQMIREAEELGLRKGQELGRREGRKEGELGGMRRLLLEVLEQRFGPLPASVETRWRRSPRQPRFRGSPAAP